MMDFNTAIVKDGVANATAFYAFFLKNVYGKKELLIMRRLRKDKKTGLNT